MCALADTNANAGDCSDQVVASTVFTWKEKRPERENIESRE